MRLLSVSIFVIVAWAGLSSNLLAAGNGAGAGGSGRQRAINSGLPPGDVGPPGSVNNPHHVTAPVDAKTDVTAHPDTTAPPPR